MISLETRTRLGPEDVITAARAYFGDELGLVEQPQEGLAIGFEGGGGGVLVSITVAEGETIVDVGAREWDEQAKQFVAQIHGR